MRKCAPRDRRRNEKVGGRHKDAAPPEKEKQSSHPGNEKGRTEAKKGTEFGMASRQGVHFFSRGLRTSVVGGDLYGNLRRFKKREGRPTKKKGHKREKTGETTKKGT